MKKILAPLLISLGSILITFGALEGAARFYYARWGNPVDQVSPILRPDAELQWRQREGVRTELWGVPVRLDERGFRGEGWLEGEENILTLGPSSAFGWGVSAENSYPELLAQLRRRDGSKAQSWNASQIGFSSAQGARLAASLEANRFSWAVVAYGINDLDRFRFFGPTGPTDAEWFALPTPVPPAWAYRSRFFYGLLQWVGAVKQKNQCGSTVYPQERVSEADFLSHFSEIAAWVEARGARPLFVTTPFHPSAASLIGEGDADELYRASVTAARAADCARARETFEAARRAEPRRLAGEVRKRNEALRRWSAERGYLLVDAATLLTGDADFLDPVHFSVRGNRRLAEALRAAIAAKAFKR